MRRACCAAAVVLAGCGGGAVPTSAPPSGGGFTPNYLGDLSGEVAAWPSRSVTVSVAAGAESASEGDLRAVVAEAARRWNDTGSGIDASVIPGDGGDIHLTFAPSADPDFAGRIVGVTTRRFQTGGAVDVMVGADVKVEAGLDPAERQAVVAHELGHALGIGGHSRTDSDLMFAVPAPPGNPTIGDANTLKTIYSSRAAPSRSVRFARFTSVTTRCGR